jgi:glycosyltransferase involved in cell wall biosynthesis
MKNQIKILFPLYFDHWAAINTVHREVAKRLPDEFHTTAVIGNKSESVDCEAFNNLVTIPTSDSNILRLLKYITLYGGRYDIVQTWGAKSDHLAVLSKIRKSKVVHTMHGATSINIKNRAKMRSRADQIVAVSEYVRNLASDLAEEQVVVIPNGIDLTLFRPDIAATTDGLISYVGRNGPNKHPEVIFDLAHQSDHIFQIFGPTFSASEVSRECPSNLRVREKVSREEFTKELSRSQIVLCPYENESFCMVALESIASGTPVVALNDGNLPALIDDDSGILCSDLHPETWKEAIDHIIQNYPQYSPRKGTEQYSWEKISQEYAQVYRSVAEGT